ncbi:MAG: hypothetical protein ACXV3T_03660 [Halobacteriota archaeon]
MHYELGPEQQNIVLLYGSLAQRLFLENYGIDIVVIVATDFNPLQFYTRCVA